MLLRPDVELKFPKPRLGRVSAVDSGGRTIFVADAHRGDGHRFIVRADEKLTAFSGTRISDSGL